MIVDGANTKQRNILINKCFYQTTVKIMNLFAAKGDHDFANKTLEVIAAYHDIIQHRRRNNFDEDYNRAFEAIDSAIRNVANKVFYIYGDDSFDRAYNSFCNYNYVQTVRSHLHYKKNK